MEEQVLEILEDISGVDEVRVDKDINLFETGLLDSLGVIELLIQLEEKMNVQIQPTEVERKDIETPNKIIAYITKRS